MAGIDFGLGQFNDRRLEKGGPICMRHWWRGHVLASDGLQEREHGKFNSRASCATIR